MSNSTMKDFLDNPWATREEQQRQQKAMARRRYAELQRAHKATMRAQQQASPHPYTQHRQADPSVDDLGTRFAGLGHPIQREIVEQRLEQKRNRRDRLRAHQEASNDLPRTMGGPGWGGD
jgi:hypothetical protein